MPSSRNAGPALLAPPVPSRRRALAVVGLCVGVAGCLEPVTPPAPDAHTGADVVPVFNPKQDAVTVDIPSLTPDVAEGDALPDGDGVESDADATEPSADAVDASDSALPDDVTAVDDASPVTPVCGDGACSEGEDCAGCAEDCGACPPVCGDGACEAPEGCATCSKDCGACPAKCAPVGSAGCAPGEQCYPDPSGNLCAKPGSLPHASDCQFWNDCAWGALCVAGRCRSVCDWTGKDAEWQCKPGVPCDKVVFAEGGNAGSNLGACRPGDLCTVLTDEGCAAGQACIPTGWLKTCLDAGDLVAGAACSHSDQCSQGLLCDGPSAGPKTCRPECHTGGGQPSCGPGSCQPVLGPDGKAIPGFVGTCG